MPSISQTSPGRSPAHSRPEAQGDSSSEPEPSETGTSSPPAATAPSVSRNLSDSLPWVPWEDLEQATNSFDEEGAEPLTPGSSVKGSSVFLCTMAVGGVTERVAVQVFCKDYRHPHWRRDDRFKSAKRGLSRPEFAHPNLFRPIGHSSTDSVAERAPDLDYFGHFSPPPGKRALVFSVPAGPTLLSLLERDSVQADGGGLLHLPRAWLGSAVSSLKNCFTWLEVLGLAPSPTPGGLGSGLSDARPKGGAEGTSPEAHEVSPLSWAQRLHIAEGVAQGLAHLHDQSIVHLRLSADNIIVDQHFKAHIDTTAVQWCWWDDEPSCNYPAGITQCWTSKIPYEMYCQTRARDVDSLGILLLQLATGQGPRVPLPPTGLLGSDGPGYQLREESICEWTERQLARHGGDASAVMAQAVLAEHRAEVAQQSSRSPDRSLAFRSRVNPQETVLTSPVNCDVSNVTEASFEDNTSMPAPVLSVSSSPAREEGGATDPPASSSPHPLLLHFQRFLALARQCCAQKDTQPTVERVVEILGEIKQGAPASEADQ